MAVAFDILGYSHQLRKDGFTQEQADALSFAARDYIMPELATKSDLQATEAALRSDFQALRNDLTATEAGLRKDLVTMETALRSDLKTTESSLRNDMNALALKGTIVVGGMISVAVGILLAAMQLILK